MYIRRHVSSNTQHTGNGWVLGLGSCIHGDNHCDPSVHMYMYMYMCGDTHCDPSMYMYMMIQTNFQHPRNNTTYVFSMSDSSLLY